MMANNGSDDLIIVPEWMMPILIHLRHLLELYKTIRKSKTVLIELLTNEIEQISEEEHGNFFIETLIGEYPYPRFFDEKEHADTFDVDPFTFDYSRNNH